MDTSLIHQVLSGSKSNSVNRVLGNTNNGTMRLGASNNYSSKLGASNGASKSGNRASFTNH